MPPRTKQRLWNVIEAVIAAAVIGGLTAIVTAHYQGNDHERRIVTLESREEMIAEIRERLARIESKLDSLKP